MGSDKIYPWFKWSPDQWENGEITVCTPVAQALFVRLCNTYWSKKGVLPYATALRRHSTGYPDAMEELVEENIIEVTDGLIHIEFLAEQLNENELFSSKQRERALKRWNKGNSDATAMPPHSDGNADAMPLREDKIKEDKNKNKNKNIGVVLPWNNKEFEEAWAQWLTYKKTQHRFKYKTPTTEQAAVKYLNELANGQMDRAIEIINYSIAQAYKGFYEPNYLKNGTGKKDWRDNDKGIGDKQQQFIRQQAGEVLQEIAQGDNN